MSLRAPSVRSQNRRQVETIAATPTLGKRPEAVYGAIWGAPRPMRFDLESEDGAEALQAYYAKPVTFEVNLRYRIDR